MEIAFRTLLILSIKFVCGKWMPELNFSPNFDQFQLYKSGLLDNVLYSSMDSKMPPNFQWQSIASVSLSYSKASYIIYGGNEQVDKNSSSAFIKKSSNIVICELLYSDSESKFTNVGCKKAETGDNNRYLGVAIQTLSLSDKEAVLVYCDPLWHVANISEPKPSGKCYLSIINDRKLDRNTSIEFCRLSSQSFLSCLGGFSVDIISHNKMISGLQMVVGMPYEPPYGRVKIVDDPFSRRQINNPSNGIGRYFNFGYAVSMATMSVVYGSSPLSDHYGPNVTNLRQDIVLTSPDNSPFSSFGLSLKTLDIDRGRSHAVVVGAPFHTVKAVENVGKVYVFCVSNDNQQSRLMAQLHGEKKDEFFGYAIANVGDINGDGNEDLAVSSPFLRNEDGRGFVTIYTVSSNCEVKVQQILRTIPSNKNGTFGLSITGGSDLDFNNWPDIAILNSRSNSIEMYVSRTRFRAQCKYSIDNNYETEPLKKDDLIKVKVHVSLFDVRRSNSVNLDFLKQFHLVSQINPNYETVEKRFSFDATKTKIGFSTSSVTVSFTIQSLTHVKNMNLSIPVIVAYRLIEDCSKNECDNIKFPLIDWEDCKANIPVKKYICNISPTCNADLSVQLVDSQGPVVIFGYDKMFSRYLDLKIFNAGPTEGKDINFRVSTFQNLRIHKIKAISTVSLKDVITDNQTEAICRLDQEELDVNSQPISIGIDVYFADFKNLKNMKYVNNSILVELFSDIKDANSTNNQARVLYSFIYEPNVTFSGSPPKDTVVDSRNRSQLIERDKRYAIDSIGPMLSHDYIVENTGNATVTNMLVKISVPMQTKDGFRILYLFDKIRGVNKSEAVWMSIVPRIYIGAKWHMCSLPSKYINPLNIIGFETHELHLRSIDIRQTGDEVHTIIRRSADGIKETQQTTVDDNTKILQGKMYRIPVEIIQCDRVGVHLKSPVCEDIICRIPVLAPNKQARVQINAWLWAHTFFKKQISDIMVYTTLRTDFYEIPEAVQLKFNKGKFHSQSQQFIFQNVKPKITHFKPWWPIIVGIVIGILILAILIVAMYKCGFFQRNKIKRRFKSKKQRHAEQNPIIIHPGDIQTASSVSSETKFTSHSALIN